MKKYIILIAALATGIMSGFAQTDSSTVRKEKKIVIIKKGFDSTWTGRDTIEINIDEDFDIDIDGDDEPMHIPMRPAPVVSNGSLMWGFSNMVINRPAVPPQLPVPYAQMPELHTGRSMHFGLENSWGFNLIAGKLRLWAGLRYDINNLSFNDPDNRLGEEQPYFTTSLDTLSRSMKSKVVNNYIGVPIALGFQSNAFDVEDGFFIRAGVNAGYRVRTHTKVKLENGNKEKAFDDFNFNSLAISPFILMGYNNIGLYARYTVTPVFAENQGEEAYAVQVGLIFQ